MKNFAPILMMLSAVGLYLVNSGGVDIVPERNDVLSQVYKADREMRVEVLTELQSMEFKDDVEMLTWFDSRVNENKVELWRPFTTAMAEILTEKPDAKYKSWEELVGAIK
jgi:hypothetical protein